MEKIKWRNPPSFLTIICGILPLSRVCEYVIWCRHNKTKFICCQEGNCCNLCLFLNVPFKFIHFFPPGISHAGFSASRDDLCNISFAQKGRHRYHALARRRHFTNNKTQIWNLLGKSAKWLFVPLRIDVAAAVLKASLLIPGIKAGARVST